jgi:hypothetical protein
MKRPRVIILWAIAIIAALAVVWLVYQNSTGKEIWSAIQTFVAVIAGYYLARGV